MKKIFGEKKYLVKQNLSKKIFVKIFFGQKDFCQKKFLVKNNCQRKKIWSNKILGQKNSG